MPPILAAWFLILASGIGDATDSVTLPRDLEYLDVTFEGPGLPPGWTRHTSHPEGTYMWFLTDSNHAGGTPREARADDCEWYSMTNYDLSLISPAMDTKGATRLLLQFKHSIRLLDGASPDCMIMVRSDYSDWVDVTPWNNPPYFHVGPETCTIDVSEFISPATQFAFYIFVGWWVDYLDFWAVDDVRVFDRSLEPYWRFRRDSRTRVW